METTSGTVDVHAILASDWPSESYRAALMVLATMHKTIPGLPDEDGDPFYVDWDELEVWSAPWSSSERVRVRLARSIAEGDLNDASYSLDRENWRVLLHALAVCRNDPA